MTSSGVPVGAIETVKEIRLEWSPDPRVTRYVFVLGTRPRRYGLGADGVIRDGHPQGRQYVLERWA